MVDVVDKLLVFQRQLKLNKGEWIVQELSKKETLLSSVKVLNTIIIFMCIFSSINMGILYYFSFPLVFLIPSSGPLITGFIVFGYIKNKKFTIIKQIELLKAELYDVGHEKVKSIVSAEQTRI